MNILENNYYCEQLKSILSEADYQRFISSFNIPIYKSLRINPLKADYQQIADEINLGEKTAFDADSYYIDEEEKPGKHPFHIAGCYYLQEPSATMVVNALDIQPGDKVLDLCAAPGGKSTHILSKLNNTGFLWSNEYDKKRANTLLSNLERWGSSNFILTNSTVEDLCPKLEGFFDKVVVDAPCSGASMFKKYPETIADYTEANVTACAKRSRHILDYAYQTLKQDGTLVYSTCTFNTEENEETIAYFLASHPDMELADTGLTCGHEGFDGQHLTRRAFPYDECEGHFVAKMIRTSPNKSVRLKQLPFSKDKLVDAFLKENCSVDLNYTIINNRIYVSDERLYECKTNILRQGILLGEIVKNRIEPHHHFFIAVKDIKKVCEIADSKQLNDYLSGLSLFADGYKGYVQIRYRGIPVGFGKGDGTQIKNKLPKGLRIV